MSHSRKTAVDRRRGQAGFSLIEIMIVTSVMAIVTGIAVVTISTSRSGLKGDGAMRTVFSTMNAARERAITQRRNMRLTFTSNSIQIVREEVPGPTLTTLSSVPFEGGVTLQLVSGLGDTPEAFGSATGSGLNLAGVAFATATEVKFAPDGTLVDQNGIALNGTVFLGLANEKLSGRAVTIFGSTGRVRAYRWDGAAWRAV
jgi:prepilin-type N-terminal cleavage/methylation domain-containing protein